MRQLCAHTGKHDRLIEKINAAIIVLNNILQQEFFRCKKWQLAEFYKIE